MNQKKAKKNRRLAKIIQRFAKTIRHKKQTIYNQDNHGVVTLYPGCLRAIYQRLKKQVSK